MSLPSIVRVPIMSVSFDSSRAYQGPSVLAYHVLIMGQRLATGTITTTRIDLVTSVEQAQLYYGAGSNLALMYAKFYENNKYTPVYCISIADAGAGVQATGTIAITGTSASVSGTLCVYIGGVRVPVAVTAGMTPTQVGDALVTAIGSNMIVSAVNTTGSVAITCRHKGEIGNEIDLRVNYADGEVTPTGLTVTITPMASGATNPTITTLISALGDNWFQVMVCPWVDTTSLTALETELSDRFGDVRMIDGVMVISKRETVANLLSFGAARNSPHVSCLHSQKVPNPGFEMAAAVGAQYAYEFSIDPAKPIHTVKLVGILAPAITDRFTWTENNTLLQNGISTFSVSDDGSVRIQNAITMYQHNDAGADDIAYLKVTTMFTLMYLRYDFRTKILTKYARAKLADDGTNFGAGQVVITPKIGKAEAISIFKGWEELGLVEDFEQFKRDIICQRNISDPDRLDWILPPDLMNQLIVGTAKIQFIV